MSSITQSAIWICDSDLRQEIDATGSGSYSSGLDSEQVAIPVCIRRVPEDFQEPADNENAP